MPMTPETITEAITLIPDPFRPVLQFAERDFGAVTDIRDAASVSLIPEPVTADQWAAWFADEAAYKVNQAGDEERYHPHDGLGPEHRLYACNLYVYAALLAGLGATVLSIDFDNRCYRQCEACDGSGVFYPSTVDRQLPPEGWAFLQRCDARERFASDKDAALAQGYPAMPFAVGASAHIIVMKGDGDDQ